MKKPIRVIFDIKPGPTSPVENAAWRRFWNILLSPVKDDPKANGGSIGKQEKEKE